MHRSSHTETPPRAVVLATWTFRTAHSTDAAVLPDGCRDLIVADRGGARRWFSAELASHAYVVEIEAGTELQGLRLRPGARIRHDALCRFMKGRDASTLLENDAVLEFVEVPGGIREILDCLATAEHGLLRCARALGVTPRTLQRTVKAATGESPSFWSQLARVRRAARGLALGTTLAGLADEHGYADQAHMTRDIRRWMGVTPTRFAADRARCAAIRDPGYG